MPEIRRESGPESPPGFIARWAWQLVALLAIVSIGGWLELHRWYALLDNWNNIHFSFEKIRGGFDSSIMHRTAVVFLLLGVAFGAIILILQSSNSVSRLVQCGLAVLVAGSFIVNVLLYPVGALDVFNYMIELKLAFHYDANPYLVTFSDFTNDPFAKHAFLVDVRLFYGPVWLLLMWIPTAISGFTDITRTLVAVKIFNVALVLVTAALIAWHQHDPRHKWVAATLFMASPLVLFEGVANAHNDVLLTLFIVGAMVALRRRSPLAGPLLALAALVKLYAVALGPIFLVVMLKERWGWKRTGRAVVLSIAAVTIVCAPYWSDGGLVEGFRSGLEESQKMDHVSILSLAKQYVQDQEAQSRPDTAYARSRPTFEIVPAETLDALELGFSIACALLILLIAASVSKGRPPELAAAESLLVVYLLMTNLYPWYLIPVFGLLALHPDLLSRIFVIGTTTLGLFYYPMFVYGFYNSGWTRFHIHLFLSLFLTIPILFYLIARVIPRSKLRFVTVLPGVTPYQPNT